MSTLPFPAAVYAARLARAASLAAEAGLDAAAIVRTALTLVDPARARGAAVERIAAAE